MRRLLCLVALLSACASVGPINDGTSLSYGKINRGMLLDAVRLPVKGDGYIIPRTWDTRGLNWGTDELVSLVVRAARRVENDAPGSTLYVADLSPRYGGPSAWHHSHQTGRDADLIFFALDDKGNPCRAPSKMVQFGADGLTAADKKGRKRPRLTFDTARNWALVRALLEDQESDVQFLFISDPLKARLLAYAAEQGEPRDLIERAEEILHQPTGALPHDDHLHVRIYCPANDRSLGCNERGPLRWFKKSYKYLEEHVKEVAAPPSVAARPFCRFLAAGRIALR